MSFCLEFCFFKLLVLEGLFITVCLALECLAVNWYRPALIDKCFFGSFCFKASFVSVLCYVLCYHDVFLPHISSSAFTTYQSWHGTPNIWVHHWCLLLIWLVLMKFSFIWIFQSIFYCGLCQILFLLSFLSVLLFWIC